MMRKKDIRLLILSICIILGCKTIQPDTQTATKSTISQNHNNKTERQLTMSTYDVTKTNPEVAAVVNVLPAVVTDFILTEDNIMTFRALAGQLSPETDFDDPILERTHVKEISGTDTIELYKYHPKEETSEKTGAVLWIHGGGHVQGDAKDDNNIITIAKGLSCPVFSVEYRLAPEHPFPAAHDDCVAAYKWIVANAEDLNLDKNKIAIAGSSAGGALAAGLMLRIRDVGLPTPSCVMLRAPMIDNMCTTPSSNVTGYPLWKSETNKSAWAMYLNGKPGVNASQYAAASRASDLSGLPPTLITVGSQDAFVDENQTFISAMQAAGSPGSIQVYDGLIHGSDALNRAAILVQDMLSTEVEFIRKYHN